MLVFKCQHCKNLMRIPSVTSQTLCKCPRCGMGYVIKPRSKSESIIGASVIGALAGAAFGGLAGALIGGAIGSALGTSATDNTYEKDSSGNGGVN